MRVVRRALSCAIVRELSGCLSGSRRLAQRKLLALAERVVALVDSSKFSSSAAHSLCELSRVHTLITDRGLDDASAKMLKSANVKVVMVDSRPSETLRVQRSKSA